MFDVMFEDVSEKLASSKEEKTSQNRRLYQCQHQDLCVYVNAVGGYSKLEQVIGVTKYVKCQERADLPIDKHLVIFDADTPENKGGFAKRREQLIEIMEKNEAKNETPWSLFLLPNNAEDGMLETLLLRALSSNATSIVPCVNGLVECFHAHNASCELKEKHKVALFAWGCCEKANKDLRFEPSLKGDATWDYTSEEFGPLRDFLKRELNIV
jgi:hypothetical protein